MLKQVINNPDSDPVEVSLDFVEFCTDNFANERLLRNGGFGEVYKGFDKELECQFAIKKKIDNGSDILLQDADPMAEWDPILLNDLCELAVQSISKNKNSRPSTKDLVSRLGALNLANETGQHPHAHYVECEDTEAHPCSCCNRHLKLHSKCSCGHVICSQCMNEQVERCHGRDIACPMSGCDSVFTDGDLYGKVSGDRYKSHLCEKTLNSELRRLSMIFATSIRLQQDAAAATAASLSRITDCVERGHKALAYLSENGEVKLCPRLVWLAFDDDNKRKGPVSWINSLAMAKIKLYFICQQTFTPVEPPLHLVQSIDK